MRVVTWNILSGNPIREGADLFSSLNHLNADVLAIQEVDFLQPRSQNSKMVEEIAKKCGYPYWAFAPALEGTPGSHWVPSEKLRSDLNQIDLPTSYGIGMLSRIPVKNWSRVSLKKSPIGLPLAITSPKGTRVAYVKDEPRVALAAELENGITIISGHLSFVPPVNTFQLRQIKKWAGRFPTRKIFLGDFNPLLFGTAGLKSVNASKSYPSWGPKVKFDYIFSEDLASKELSLEFTGVSDHLPIGVDVII
jgi:endonuclease/exonuclease/phosphatase family metal-dependent hydrolase